MPSIHVVQVNVSDMDQAIDFYCAKLGFQIRSRDYYPDIVVLEHGLVPLVLYRVTTLVQLDKPDSGPFSLVLAIETDNLQSYVHDLRGKAIETIHSAPLNSPVGVYASIKDPFGNVVHLVRVATPT